MKRRIKQTGAPRATEDKVGVEDLYKVDSLIPGQKFIAKIITIWTMGELIFRILSSVLGWIRDKTEKREERASFIVFEGTTEFEALMAMCAIYMSERSRKSSTFRLEKNSDVENFKPLSGCILDFNGSQIVVDRDEPEERQQRMTNKWNIYVPVVVLNEFLDAFEKHVDLSGSVVDGVYRWSGWSWSRKSNLPKNRVAILPSGQMEKIIEDSQRFLKAKDVYEERGIPWRRGYLFYGAPGTGKTSTAIYLAICLSRSVYCISSKDVSESDFEDALNSLPRGAIVLIEDVDCLFEASINSRDKKRSKGSTANTPVQYEDDEEKKTISLSDFLNAIDGVSSHKDGRILILTTNHVDRIDPAILRPGRIDIKLEFGPADKEQLKILCARMLGSKTGHSYYNRHFKIRKTPITMAEAENMLLPVVLEEISKA
jgi:hypothetical protein